MNILKTDYLDAVFAGNRKYQQTTNGDGTVSFTDRTEYTQEGDRFGAEDINDTNSAINALFGRTTATLVTGSWLGSSAPYTNTVSVSGITSTDTPIIALNLASNTAAATVKATQKCWSFVTKITSGNGSITAYAYQKPTVDIPIVIKGV